ncbi:MAG: hypothetical protein US47_C0001G0426 [Candidatus Moranbacteria bacterium GW2011_GWE1_37_24]|nr:MAG: hypothetical protein US47_C0001G0426 [Candidatus Moranbacteria bacterium GW2011_GWE1_37_24]
MNIIILLKHKLSIFLVSCIFIYLGSVGVSAASFPVLLFSDLTDAPVSGWEGSPTKGAAISIWGRNLGTERGSSYVTIGGVNLTNDSDYAEWGATTNPTTASGQQRITFNTEISITTADGTSETIPFYTRNTGNIYFVSTTGNDSNDGLSVASAWTTFGKARETVVAGDVVYFKSGIWTAYDHGSTWANAVLYFRTTSGVSNHNNGTLNNSIAFSSYPGEVAQMCNGNNADGGNATSGFYRHGDSVQDRLEYWTLSKFKVVAWHYGFKWSNIDLTYDNNLRIIGWDATTTIPRTDINTPESIGGQIMSQNGDQDDIYILGNYMHHSGLSSEEDEDNFGYKVQSIYISGFNGQYSNIHIGHNDFAHNSGNLQVYAHNSSDIIDDIYIYDNWFHDGGTTGMVLNGGDGLTEYSFITTAYVYNNIFSNNLSYAAKLTDGSTGSHGGTFYFYNNTCYNNSDAEIFSPNPAALYVVNNIFQTSALVYFSYSPGDDSGNFGSHNLFYGSVGAIPSWSTNNIIINPLFTSPSTNDFTLQSTSPAINAGTTLASVPNDFLGVSRPQGISYDIGAFEYVSAAEETCTDNIQNQDETGIDCGGVCEACVVPITYGLSNFISAITNWLGIGNETSDVNSDGVVNTRDLGVMMSGWSN